MRSGPCKLLDTGDFFPAMEFPTATEETIFLPKAFEGN